MIEWQLLHEGRCPARKNMSKDLELFEAVRVGTINGAFRIYNWKEPALTIGYHQKEFIPCDRSLSIPIIKRPTGGGAVLHKDDFTFSISSPLRGFFSDSLPDCSRIVGQAFASAFQCSGVRASLKGCDHAFSEICFDRASPYELVVEENKIMGLALARMGGFILIQGVIPLQVDHVLYSKVFGISRNKKPNGILEYYPGFSGGLFLDCLRNVFMSQLGVLLHECQEHGHKHSGTNE